MRYKQRIALIVGGVLLLAALLCPPWRFVIRAAAQQSSVGYWASSHGEVNRTEPGPFRPIFNPPESANPYAKAQVDYGRLGVVCASILVGTGIAVLLLGMVNSPSQPDH
jgi:hypothetical protein